LWYFFCECDSHATFHHTWWISIMFFSYNYGTSHVLANSDSFTIMVVINVEASNIIWSSVWQKWRCYFYFFVKLISINKLFCKNGDSFTINFLKINYFLSYFFQNNFINIYIIQHQQNKFLFPSPTSFLSCVSSSCSSFNLTSYNPTTPSTNTLKHAWPHHKTHKKLNQFSKQNCSTNPYKIIGANARCIRKFIVGDRDVCGAVLR